MISAQKVDQIVERARAMTLLDVLVLLGDCELATDGRKVYLRGVLDFPPESDEMHLVLIAMQYHRAELIQRAKRMPTPTETPLIVETL